MTSKASFQVDHVKKWRTKAEILWSFCDQKLLHVTDRVGDGSSYYGFTRLQSAYLSRTNLKLKLTSELHTST